jgi:hypothetical protein
MGFKGDSDVTPLTLPCFSFLPLLFIPAVGLADAAGGKQKREKGMQGRGGGKAVCPE